MKDTLASVVIPVGPGADTLGQCLAAVSRQDFKKAEVIVVCDARARDLPALPEGSEELRVIKERHHTSLGHLANAGMLAARGHVKVLLRPNCMPVGTGWLRSMVEPFEDEDVGVVVSQCMALARPASGLSARLMDAVDPPCRRSAQPGLRPLDRVSHLCDAYRASLLADIGYFQTDGLAPPGQAVDVSVKVADAGYTIVLSDAAVVDYWPAPSRRRLAGAVESALRYGYSDAVLDRLYELRWLNAGVFAAAFFSLFLVPLGLVSLPAAVMASVALFVVSAFLSLRMPVLRWEWPLMVLNFAAFVGLVLLVRDNWRPDLFGKVVHPAVIRQWCWLAAITGSDLLLVARAALVGAVRALRQPRGWLYTVPVFCLGALWWLLAGVGYMAGRLLPPSRKE